MTIQAAEAQIEREYYDSGWHYMNHAGFNAEADDQRFQAYRARRLVELLGKAVVANKIGNILRGHLDNTNEEAAEGGAQKGRTYSSPDR